MLIDWFTLIAQIINFLVLVWLLKRFLYKPILKTIDEREKRIAMKIQEAEVIKKEATQELDDFRQKNQEFDRQRQELLTKAISEVDTERQRLIKQTRSDIEKLRLNLQETIRNEQQKLGSEIVQRTRTEIFSIVRKTLRDLASVSLEDQMTEVFIHRLKHMEKGEKEVLISKIKLHGDKIILRSAFELSQNQQNRIEEIIQAEFSGQAKITFQASPNLVSGIELVTDGHKLVWSIDDYLLSLEKNIAELLTVKNIA
ncbi:MAG: F0F1 ATP synthase subunit B [Bacteroidetes bacterium]|nr:MAG: F0F1 ATP synthase subunit B [Bacteroidota bacterium]